MNMSEQEIIQFQSELNEFIDALDSLQREEEDARWEAMAEENEEIEFGMAVMGV